MINNWSLYGVRTVCPCYTDRGCKFICDKKFFLHPSVNNFSFYIVNI